MTCCASLLLFKYHFYAFVNKHIFCCKMFLLLLKCLGINFGMCCTPVEKHHKYIFFFSQQLPKVPQRAKALFNLMLQNHSRESALAALEIVGCCLCLQRSQEGFVSWAAGCSPQLLPPRHCTTLASRILNFVRLITHQLISDGFHCLVELLVFVSYTALTLL